MARSSPASSPRPERARSAAPPGCAFCGLACPVSSIEADGVGRARMELALRTCADCASLDPHRSAAHLLGVAEENAYLTEALKAEPGALDGLISRTAEIGSAPAAGHTSESPGRTFLWRHWPRWIGHG